ncbi:hypothetical protein [Bradyrhizobium sp. RD5-C2]|uniref:hypothetical protein n=1 Tax=Bradyrhizobium sp. RD5-C2 TaxID=244562 RepID=UPI001CC4A4EC|nr:hypothetical protein [Bradyrhizobium sp. RD5-C2]GIQ76534.1 hypothetical protein BraRD5C2_49800 [Bradyrhizobium sp. RD5-C2]
MKSVELSLFADYSQFYIQDESASGDLSTAWTEEATDRMLAIASGTVGIGTVRNMHVPVSAQILEREPDHDFSDWDHVVEASLDVASGRIVIAGCTDYFPDAMRIETAPGTYRVRASYGALDTLSEDGLEGDDHYRLQLWPAPSIAVRVLKQRPT